MGLPVQSTPISSPNIATGGAGDVHPGGGERGRSGGRGPGPLAAWGTIALAGLIAALLAVWSDGNYMDDDVTHYLIARTAWERPSLLTDEWGRPGFTVPYALVAWVGPAQAGFIAARLLSVGIMAATMWLTWRVARGVRAPYAWATPLLLVAMPLYFHLSYTTTTETIAALYAIAGTWLLMQRRYGWAAVVLALLPITRHELVVFLVPVGLWLLWRRRIGAALLLGWAEVTWNAIVWVMAWQPPSGKLPIQRFFSTGDPGLLGYGSPIHFMARWWDLGGIVIAGLSLGGAMWVVGRVWRVARRGGGGDGGGAAAGEGLDGGRCGGGDGLMGGEVFEGGRCPGTSAGLSGHRARMRLMIVGGALGLVGLQTYLYMVNTHLSGGYARFLIPGAPWLAICAAWGMAGAVRGLRDLCGSDGERGPGRGWDNALRAQSASQGQGALRAQGEVREQGASREYGASRAEGASGAQGTGRAPLSRRGRWAVGALLFAAVFSLVPVTTPYVSHLTRGLLAVMLLGVLIRRQPWMARAALGLCLVVAVCEWRFLCRPHRLTAEQVLLRDTLAELRAMYPNHYITGSTPWVEYFQNAAVNLPRWHDPLPWDPQKHPLTTLYILERTHGSGKHFVVDALERLPHRIAMEAMLDGQPQLTVYERLE